MVRIKAVVPNDFRTVQRTKLHFGANDTTDVPCKDNICTIPYKTTNLMPS